MFKSKTNHLYCLKCNSRDIVVGLEEEFEHDHISRHAMAFWVYCNNCQEIIGKYRGRPSDDMERVEEEKK